MLLKISVVIPTYNRKSFLVEAIETALSQNYPNFEVIVSDNGSTDGTDVAVQKYMDRQNFVYNRNDQNIGMVDNWKKAIFEIASGTWFLILSDDDYLIDPDFLSEAASLINRHPDLTLVYAGGYLLDCVSGEKEILNLPFSGIVDGKSVFSSRGTVAPRDFTLCSVLFNKALAQKLGAFSNPYNVCCDSELFLLSCLYGSVGILPGYPSVYRFHPDNLTLSIAKNPLLLSGDLDMFVVPYRVARELGFYSEAELFRKNTNLDRFIVERLLMVAKVDPFLFSKLKKELSEKSVGFTDIVLSNFKIRITALFYESFLYRAFLYLKRMGN